MSYKKYLHDKKQGSYIQYRYSQLLIMLLFVIIMTSCSSSVRVKLYPFYKGEINITMTIEDFFAQYLFDLMGAKNVSDLVQEKMLRKYLSSVDAVNDVKFVYEGTYQVTIQLYSSNFIATLEDMNLIKDRKLIAQNMQEIYFEFSRDAFLAMLQQIPQYKNELVKQAFFPDNNSFAKKDYAGYLAWAFSEYGDSKLIKERLESSVIQLEMTKVGQGKIPDEGWNKDILENTQHINYSVMDMMNKKDLKLSFTF